MAASTLRGNVIASPNFGIIDINPAEVADALQVYVERGSRLTGVALDDLDLTTCRTLTAAEQNTLAGLISGGVKLFDAIVWLSAGRPASHPLTHDVAKTEDSLPSLHEIARSVFYVYFFLLTQARYPVKGNAQGKPLVSNFLRQIMGMNDDQGVYIDRICSFDPQKFDPRWIQGVTFAGLGQESISRFGLGVAGYRMFGPFKIYAPRAGIAPNLQQAYEFARNVARHPATWDIHPLTRNVNILTSRGNLNKNLGNLILEVFSDEDIAQMVTSKMLYARPVVQPTYQNYKTWASNDDISGTRLIFPN